MKATRTSLATFLKCLFAGLECIVGISTIVTLCWMVVVRHNSGPWSLGTIGLRLDPSVYHLSLLKSAGLSFHDVFGSVTVNFLDAAPHFRSLLWPICGFFLCKTLTWIALCDFFRRMFRNVERREVFSPGSIGTIRKIGALIIILTFTSALIVHWLDVRTRDFAIKNLVSQGAVTIDMRPPPADGISAGMSFSTRIIQNFSIQIDENRIALGPISIEFRPILLGLVLIGLGEALRQGLVLKEENEYTV